MRHGYVLIINNYHKVYFLQNQNKTQLSSIKLVIYTGKNKLYLLEISSSIAQNKLMGLKMLSTAVDFDLNAVSHAFQNHFTHVIRRWDIS